MIPIEYSRVSELTQRINKCTNGIRFTVYGIKENLEDEVFELYSVHVSDKFSDISLVGVFAIKEPLSFYSACPVVRSAERWRARCLSI